MQVVKLSQKNTDDLETFCFQCKLVGYQNNSTLHDLKWGKQFDLPSMAEYWAIYKDNQIISLAGCHSFDSSAKSLRCLFRAATLPEYFNLIKGLSKNHMNSLSFSMILPKQIEFGLANGYTEFLITTTLYNDASGHMQRTHKAMQLISKNGIVEHIRDTEYYYTEQSIWRINLPKYFDSLNKFSHSTSYI